MNLDEKFFLNLVELENNFYKDITIEKINELSKIYSVIF
jgi:hypothetical protein